ncbi:hypothetical protein GOP47_0012968 [Adiantum capillus-veneris]|uniref:Uncharacterized protein n=1 Tax=Adiantum capillus-veneris TaxID=13818 RepID=A0A9D4ZG71_ADICA|nr:hypothetical protein GOP47_0012968 [Adiantum capillus-veneris]
MFFEISMKRLIVLQPKHLYTQQCEFLPVLLTQLILEVNKMKCSEDHGFYVTPTTFKDIGQGRVRSITGAVAFPVEFNCIVFKPFKGQILEGEVKRVYRSGCFLSCGPLDDVFLHEAMMSGCRFFQNEGTESACFKNEDEGFEIRAKTILRVRLIGVKWVEDQCTFKSLASINGDYLGLCFV